MELYLIRHAQSQWQTKETKSKNSEITELGYKQSYYLNNYMRKILKKDAIESAIYVSPLIRSLQTVESLKCKYVLSSNIIEASFHVASKLPYFSTPHLYKRELSVNRSYNKFKNLIRELLNTLIEENLNKKIILYTHGGVIKTILRIIHDNDCVCYEINNCSITHIKWDESRWKLKILNDVSFMPRKYIT